LSGASKKTIEPLISVIVPNYNGGRYLAECLRSITTQGYENKEIIVVDGLSTDNSWDIIQSFNVRAIRAEPHGEAEAINRGMALAKGDILTYIDSDDLFPPSTLSIVGEYFAKAKAKWAIGLGRYVDKDSNHTRKGVMTAKRFMLKHYSYNTLRLFDYLIQPAVFWRRELWDELGMFRVDEKLAFEYEWWLRAGQKYKPGFINADIGIWRMHGTSVTSGGLIQSAKDAMRLQREYTKSLLLRLLQYLSYLVVRMVYAGEKR
jgi:glycosyltransferase involved in cell wall biosynthesis